MRRGQLKITQCLRLATLTQILAYASTSQIPIPLYAISVGGLLKNEPSQN